MRLSLLAHQAESAIPNDAHLVVYDDDKPVGVVNLLRLGRLVSDFASGRTHPRSISRDFHRAVTINPRTP